MGNEIRKIMGYSMLVGGFGWGNVELLVEMDKK